MKVLPKTGGVCLVLLGDLKGRRGRLMEKDKKREEVRFSCFFLAKQCVFVFLSLFEAHGEGHEVRGGACSVFLCVRRCVFVFVPYEEVRFCFFLPRETHEEGQEARGGACSVFLCVKRCVSVFISREEVRFGNSSG